MAFQQTVNRIEECNRITTKDYGKEARHDENITYLGYKTVSRVGIIVSLTGIFRIVLSSLYKQQKSLRWPETAFRCCTEVYSIHYVSMIWGREGGLTRLSPSLERSANIFYFCHTAQQWLCCAFIATIHVCLCDSDFLFFSISHYSRFAYSF